MDWIGRTVLLAVGIPATAWMALALHFDLRGSSLRNPLAIFLALFSLALLILLPIVAAALAWGALFAVVLWWWLSLKPRADRDWLPEVARPPQVTIEGDKILIRDFRDFDYTPQGDQVPRYLDRTLDLGRLETLDYFVSHWSGPLIAHTMVSFGFGGDDYLCLSVEVRRERGQAYSALKGFFRQFEIIYVIGSERDLVRLRTSIRREEVYLYRVRVPPERMRRYLVECLRRAEALAARPEWYNALTSNCTTNLFSHMAEGPKARDMLEILLNGFSARYLYQRGGFADHLSFEELQARSSLREAALSAGDGADFSRRIRAGLVEPRPLEGAAR